jgi:hypothetical protein
MLQPPFPPPPSPPSPCRNSIFPASQLLQIGPLSYLTDHKKDKKENKMFLIYKKIQNGAVAKSYMTNGLLIYGLIFAHFLIY